MKNKRHKIIFYIIALAFTFCCVFTFSTACGSDSKVSQTNNQTAGIDESDIVKVTEDGFIFKAQSDGLTVSKAVKGSIDVIVKQPYQDYTPIEMLVTDSLLMLFGNKKVTIEGTSAKMLKAEIKIFDLNKLKTNTTGYAIRSSEFYGSFYTARLVDNQIFVLTRLSYSSYYGETDVNYYYDSLLSIKQFERIDDLAANKNQKSNYSGFIAAKYDLDNINEGGITAKLFCGENISDIYCSPYALYAISDYYTRTQGCFYTNTHTSKITKISLTDLSLSGELRFNGSILNRYSLYDNGLALYAVVSGYYGGHQIVAYDKNLKFIGQSQSFAHGETLYSVMFDEDICYAVTFRQVDPLFKFDIINPTSIKLLGELKIDGYSTHMQSFSAGTLIGLGFETNSWAQSTGVKITLFDTYYDNPVEINSILFSQTFGSNSSSIATRDPKAILCEPQNNIFIIPVRYTSTVSKDSESNLHVRQGAVVFGVKDGKLTQLAFLTNFDDEENAIDQSKTVIRTVRIEDYLYTISDGFITSYSLIDFELIQMVKTKIKA